MRPVGSEQSIDLFTQREEIDFDFRVSGLQHAVVKQAENFRVRELLNKTESHPHRQALEADLQQSHAYNPLSEKSKKMIREMGNVELFKLCETVPKLQRSQCLLYWNQGVIYCTCGHLLVESESSQKIHKLRLDALSIPNYVIKKGRLHHGKTEAQKSTSQPIMRAEDVSKRILMEFTIAFRKTLHIVMHNSKLAGPRRSASRWTGWHRKISLIAHQLRSLRDRRKTGISR